jgi:hypothetical protein
LIAGFFVEMLGKSPASSAVSDAIRTIVELFRALQQPPRKAVQGLWAEVLLIAESSKPETLIRSWHVLPEDRYDFSSGADRLEVKSTGGAQRVHHFSLEQLRPPAGTTTLVASVRVERSGGGASLEELLAALRHRLTIQADLMLRVEVVVASTLGNSLRAGLRERFDLELARGSVALFDIVQIPTITGPIPREITDVRFRSDLTGLVSVQPHVFKNGSQFFDALWSDM